MLARSIACALVLLAGFATTAATAQSRAVPVVSATEKRVAVVVGNGSYKQAPLANPVNDAKLIAERFRGLGFEVQMHLDLSAKAFRRVLREYVELLKRQDGVAIFYYAGHGVQIEGRNFLLPVDIDLTDQDEVRYNSVDIDEMFISRLDKVRAQARIVILDACRDDPFAGRSRNIRAAGGLAEMAARGTLIAYASAPGATAEDGPTGGNSVYTRNLADELLTPGIEVEQMFKRVRVKVLGDTKERQVPWVNTSLTVSFSFNPRTGPDPAEAERQARISALENELAQTRDLLEKAKLRIAQADTTPAPAPTLALATPAPATPSPAREDPRPEPAVQEPAPRAQTERPAPPQQVAMLTPRTTAERREPVPMTPAPAASAPADPAPAAQASARKAAALEEVRRLEKQIRDATQALNAVKEEAQRAKAAGSAMPIAKYVPPPEEVAETVVRSAPVGRAKCTDLIMRLSMGEVIGAEAENYLHTECKK